MAQVLALRWVSAISACKLQLPSHSLARLFAMSQTEAAANSAGAHRADSDVPQLATGSPQQQGRTNSSHSSGVQQPAARSETEDDAQPRKPGEDDGDDAAGEDDGDVFEDIDGDRLSSNYHWRNARPCSDETQNLIERTRQVDTKRQTCK